MGSTDQQKRVQDDAPDVLLPQEAPFFQTPEDEAFELIARRQQSGVRTAIGQCNALSAAVVADGAYQRQA